MPFSSNTLFGPVEQLGHILTDLDAIGSDTTGVEQQLVEEAKRDVAKLQSAMKRSQVEQVVQLVRAKEWLKAMEKMKRYFPGDVSIGFVEEVVALVYVGSNLDDLTSAIKWAGHLDTQLQPQAYQVLYEQIKFKSLSEKPQVLLLRRRIKKLPVGVLDDVRAQLDEDFRRIVEQIVVGVKEKEYSLIMQIDEMDDSLSKKIGQCIMAEIVTEVVKKFETCSLEDTLLLVQFSLKLPRVASSCYFIGAMLGVLEANSLLDSIQGMLIWSHAKYTKEEESKWNKLASDTQKFCTDALEKLTKYRARFFMHYKKYIDDEDKQKVKHLHDSNWHLQSIVSEFVTFYYNRDDLTRAQNLLAAAKAIPYVKVTQRILSQLQEEMRRSQQICTFEAFRLFNEVKRFMTLDSYKSRNAKVKASFEQLRAKAPSCLRLLLWPRDDEKHFQLVNKFFDSPLCIIQQDTIVCSNSPPEREQLCSATVHRDLALTTLTFLSSDDALLTLDASAPHGMTKVAWNGIQWRLTAAGEHHVKLSTQDDLFLMAGEQWENDSSKRVVCLKRENCTDMQLWRIEPVKKKIKLEFADVNKN